VSSSVKVKCPEYYKWSLIILKQEVVRHFVIEFYNVPHSCVKVQLHNLHIIEDNESIEHLETTKYEPLYISISKDSMNNLINNQRKFLWILRVDDNNYKSDVYHCGRIKCPDNDPWTVSTIKYIAKTEMYTNAYQDVSQTQFIIRDKNLQILNDDKDMTGYGLTPSASIFITISKPTIFD
jgi:hypothetical protein